MNNYLRIKLAFTAIGIIILIWGLRADDRTIRWVGIALLAVSVLMRLIPKRLRQGDYPRTPEAPGQ